MTDDSTSKIESIADKITKLLAKAESTTPAEAEALTAKATELMIRWSIDEAVIAARRGGKVADKIVEKTIEVGGIYWMAHQSLGIKVGSSFGFKCVQRNWSYQPKMKGAFMWVGFESDITKAELLYTSLLIQSATGLAKFSKQWKNDFPQLGGMEAFKARRSFLFGFGDAVYDRLVAQFRVETAKASRAENDGARGTTSVELVLADRKQQVRSYYDEKYGHLRASKGKRLSGGVGGRQAGVNAGMAANLGGTGITGSKGSLNA